jgi:hypothetical protein
MGGQSARATAAAAQWRDAADLAGKPGGRDLPLPRRRPAGIFGHGSQDDPGLDPPASFQGGARRRRCRRLGRQDQDLRHHHRPEPPDRLRAHAAAGATSPQQQQHQRRRADGKFRAAGGGGARHRAHPLDRRDPQHDADRQQRFAGADERCRNCHRRAPAAARHRRHGRRRRHRRGHRSDAARRAKHTHHQACPGGGGEDQRLQHPAARRADPKDLRSQRPDRRHDAHRAAQYDLRHRADFPGAVAVLGQSPQRRHRRDHHPVRTLLRHRHHGLARRVGEPALRGRHRFRPSGRRHGDHGRERLPSSRAEAGGAVRPLRHHAS